MAAARVIGVAVRYDRTCDGPVRIDEEVAGSTVEPGIAGTQPSLETMRRTHGAGRVLKRGIPEM